MKKLNITTLKEVEEMLEAGMIKISSKELKVFVLLMRITLAFAIFIASYTKLVI